MTSDESRPSARTGYRDALHDLLAGIIGVVARSGVRTHPRSATAASAKA